MRVTVNCIIPIECEGMSLYDDAFVVKMRKLGFKVSKPTNYNDPVFLVEHEELEKPFTMSDL